MNSIFASALLLLPLTASAQIQSNYLKCFNPATGFQFELGWQNHPDPNNRKRMTAQYKINTPLYQSLQLQVGGLQESFHDGTVSQYHSYDRRQVLSFKSSSITFVMDESGAQLVYTSDDRPRSATFNFNPGECK